MINENQIDKIHIATAIKNSSIEGNLNCSLLLNEVLIDCSSCSLKPICSEIDKLIELYTKQTTTVVDSFSFD